MELNTWYQGALTHTANAFVNGHFLEEQPKRGTGLKSRNVSVHGLPVWYKVVPRGGHFKVIMTHLKCPGTVMHFCAEVGAVLIEGQKAVSKADLYMLETLDT